MKNIVKLFGIVALAAVIGFSMTACDDGGGGDGGDPGSKGVQAPANLRGKWTGVSNFYIEFNGDKFNYHTVAGLIYIIVQAEENGKIVAQKTDAFGKPINEYALICDSYTIEGNKLRLIANSDDANAGAGTLEDPKNYPAADIRYTVSNSREWTKVVESGSDITYTAAADNTTNTTKINFTFNKAVTGLTAGEISITNGTGNVTKGSISGSGTSWSIGVTVNTAGNVTVKINKAGIESENKTVQVYKGSSSGIPEELFDVTWVRTSDSATIKFSKAGSSGASYETKNGSGQSTGGGLLNSINGSSFTTGGSSGTTYTYSISGSTLTITGTGALAGTYTKQSGGVSSATVSISVDVYNNTSESSTYKYVDIILTLSDGAWTSTGWDNTSVINAVKQWVTVSPNYWSLEIARADTLEIGTEKELIVSYFETGTGSGNVTATLNTAKLSEMKGYTNVTESLTAGTTTDSDSDWTTSAYW
jgi:hypothetical protein